jgi:hypothetical protein
MQPVVSLRISVAERTGDGRTVYGLGNMSVISPVDSPRPVASRLSSSSDAAPRWRTMHARWPTAVRGDLAAVTERIHAGYFLGAGFTWVTM